MLYEQYVRENDGPQTEFPLRCRVTGGGVLECLNNESRGELPPVGVARRAPPPFAPPPFAPPPFAPPPFAPPPVPFDTPLSRILSRGAVGPWVLVGAAIASAGGGDRERDRGRRRSGSPRAATDRDHDDDNDNNAAALIGRDRTMRVFAQNVDVSRDRYNYRVVDSNNVPLDVEENVRWLDDGDALFVPGYGRYRLRLYGRFSN